MACVGWYVFHRNISCEMNWIYRSESNCMHIVAHRKNYIAWHQQLTHASCACVYEEASYKIDSNLYFWSKSPLLFNYLIRCYRDQMQKWYTRIHLYIVQLNTYTPNWPLPTQSNADRTQVIILMKYLAHDKCPFLTSIFNYSSSFSRLMNYNLSVEFSCEFKWHGIIRQ